MPDVRKAWPEWMPQTEDSLVSKIAEIPEVPADRWAQKVLLQIEQLGFRPIHRPVARILMTRLMACVLNQKKKVGRLRYSPM